MELHITIWDVLQDILLVLTLVLVSILDQDLVLVLDLYLALVLDLFLVLDQALDQVQSHHVSDQDASHLLIQEILGQVI